MSSGPKNAGRDFKAEWISKQKGIPSDSIREYITKPSGKEVAGEETENMV
jgi:hypothetical protein